MFLLPNYIYDKLRKGVKTFLYFRRQQEDFNMIECTQNCNEVDCSYSVICHCRTAGTSEKSQVPTVLFF